MTSYATGVDTTNYSAIEVDNCFINYEYYDPITITSDPTTKVWHEINWVIDMAFNFTEIIEICFAIYHLNELIYQVIFNFNFINYHIIIIIQYFTGHI